MQAPVPESLTRRKSGKASWMKWPAASLMCHVQVVKGGRREGKSVVARLPLGAVRMPASAPQSELQSSSLQS